MANQNRVSTRLTTARRAAGFARETAMVFSEASRSPDMEGEGFQAHAPPDMDVRQAPGPPRVDMDVRQALDLPDTTLDFPKKSKNSLD